VGDYGDVDQSAAKDYILAHKDRPGIKPLFELSFSKRPAEELYDLRTDPHQLVNVADRAEFASGKRALREQLERWMRDTADPRVDPDYDAWDKYPYFGGKIGDKTGKAK
jgi:uncharacterized sulfatase